MCLFRSIINKFWNKNNSNTTINSGQTQNIIIKPNGTWSVAQTPKPPMNPPTIIPPPVVPGKDYLLYHEPEVETVSFPPEFSPMQRSYTIN